MTGSAPSPRTRGARAPRGRSRGMTLIEVMVAVGLSLVVLTAVAYAVIAQRVNVRYGTELAQVQGNGQLALDTIGRNIRQAGFIGCNSALQRFNDPRVLETTVVPAIIPDGGTGFSISANSAIRAFPGNSTHAAWTATKPAGVVDTSHVIEVSYASLDGATRLSNDILNNGEMLTTMGTLEPGRGDDTPTGSGRLALLSDCQSAMVISIDSVVDSTITLPTDRRIGLVPCGHASRVGSACIYWPSAVVYPIRVVQFYVADFGTTSAPDLRLMMRKRVMRFDTVEWNAPQEVMRGAARLRVTGIGLDATGVTDPTFAAARNIDEVNNGPDPLTSVADADWARVVRLDLRLQMQPSKGKQAGDAPLIRNFESSYTVRARTTADPS